MDKRLQIALVMTALVTLILGMYFDHLIISLGSLIITLYLKTRLSQTNTGR
ncbi:hypothetical protein JIR001_11170 [Polycladomyces abyssicola]|uniref:Uncharacterized protein n=1 Tax=Polycladomyces abyssicola TaxID=1125966 RepID=A0A8D5UE12_9BACL|nr:hypothetical protein JIR001_11170 [Polycladomyces abyssicola]